MYAFAQNPIHNQVLVQHHKSPLNMLSLLGPLEPKNLMEFCKLSDHKQQYNSNRIKCKKREEEMKKSGEKRREKKLYENRTGKHIKKH